MWINPNTGKRFVNELANRKVRADAIIATGNVCLSMAQESVAKQFGQLNDPRMQAALRAGTMKKFDNYDAIAAEYKINPAGFKEQIAKYNEMVDWGVDDEFKRPMKKGVYFKKPPYYVTRLWPKVHHTMGGIQINEKAQAIGLDGKPIPGLYAAGEVTGGIHGAVRLGSVAVVDCLVFGRIAGQSAAS
jgi:succinate dehydrogenase/fumarate reductase flavoprotein subunit